MPHLIGQSAGYSDPNICRREPPLCYCPLYRAAYSAALQFRTQRLIEPTVAHLENPPCAERATYALTCGMSRFRWAGRQHEIRRKTRSQYRPYCIGCPANLIVRPPKHPAGPRLPSRLAEILIMRSNCLRARRCWVRSGNPVGLTIRRKRRCHSHTVSASAQTVSNQKGSSRSSRNLRRIMPRDNQQEGSFQDERPALILSRAASSSAIRAPHVCSASSTARAAEPSE